MLAAGWAAQASFSAISFGVAAIAPTLRDVFDLDLQGLGVLLAALWLGLTVALVPWGFVADRVGERAALAVGLGVCGLLLASLSLADSLLTAVVILALAGAAGASVQSASGRAVMLWFGPHERGLAFGVRQTAVTIGGALGSLAAPATAAAGGVDAAFVFLGGLCVATADGSWLVIRDRPRPAERGEAWSLRDRRLWALCCGSGFYVVPQVALLSFLVLYLHDDRGFSEGRAAAVLALVFGLATALRIVVGRWSDVVRSRIVPLRGIGIAIVVTLGAAAALLESPIALVAPLLVVGGALAAAWNGLAFAEAAELAGPTRSGAAIGFQQAALAIVGVVVPPAFGAIVAATSWRAGFAVAALAPLAGWIVLVRVRV